ncbi:MAG TPA: class I SAM-dependent methyltransferase [Solirubrobacteraceae bacterium]|nr:class I SAM-dependent methyltransferase [Solirubrobacteraceae bacterium]
MSYWQERITRETAPSIRAEHELRYRIAAPLILAAGPWVDLGCGNGVAAAIALGDARPAHAVLVDIEAQAVALAARELGMPEAVQLDGDLTDPGDLQRIGEALLDFEGDPVVTCFEVVEHLSTFVPLLEWAGTLARERGATFVISVPNDAFWSIQNPHHLTAWSEGAFEELRRLLPSEHTLFRQVAITGSALAGWDDEPVEHEFTIRVGAEGTVATHFIAAVGPRHRDLWRGALAVQTDMLEERRWERQRESNVALAEQMVRENKAAVEAQELIIVKQREELRGYTATFDEWRAYIHELERELGRPLSGSSAEDSPT